MAEEAALRIVSWNIRAGGGRRVPEIAEQLAQWDPALVALSEFRGTPPSQQLAAALAGQGLTHQLMTVDATQPAVNALLLAARFPLTRIHSPHAPQPSTRWLLAHVQTPHPLTIGVMHIPNYVSKKKHPYFQGVLNVVEAWRDGPGLLIGDTNTGRPGLDEEVPCFTRTEEEWLDALETRGWRDAFRHIKGEERAYTWYSPNGGNGFRLDEAFPNRVLWPQVLDMRYAWGTSAHNPTRRDALSDHAAILLDISCQI